MIIILQVPIFQEGEAKVRQQRPVHVQLCRVFLRQRRRRLGWVRACLPELQELLGHPGVFLPRASHSQACVKSLQDRAVVPNSLTRYKLSRHEIGLRTSLFIFVFQTECCYTTARRPMATGTLSQWTWWADGSSSGMTSGLEWPTSLPVRTWWSQASGIVFESQGTVPMEPYR